MLGILSVDSDFAAGVSRCAGKASRRRFRILANQMGYSAEEAAFDCWRVVNANMSQAVTRNTAGKGIDPKEMVMLAYGGKRTRLCRHPGRRSGHREGPGAESIAGFLRAGHSGGQASIDEERSYISAASPPGCAKAAGPWRSWTNAPGIFRRGRILKAGCDRADIS